MILYITGIVFCFAIGIFLGINVSKEINRQDERLAFFHKEMHQQMEINNLKCELNRKDKLITEWLDNKEE